MNVVIPVRAGTRNESLRYALRAWENIGVEDVLVIGGKPTWYKGPHITTAQKTGTDNQWNHNFLLALRAAIEAKDEPFWWSADDIFPLKKFKEHTFCRMTDFDLYLAAWNARPLHGYTKKFVEGMTSQRDIMRELGYNTQNNADMHMPHLLDPGHLEALLDLLAKDFSHHPAGHFRAIYGAMHPGNIVRVKDPKVVSHQALNLSTGFVSTATSSWRSRAGTYLRKEFNQPSQWEKR